MQPATTFGLPWPCYGTPELKHPGRPICMTLPNASWMAAVISGRTLAWSATGFRCWLKMARIQRCRFDHRLPGVHVLLKKAWLVGTNSLKRRRKARHGKNWKTDSTGGIIPRVHEEPAVTRSGNAKARAVVWNGWTRFRNIANRSAAAKPDMLAKKYPTHADKRVVPSGDLQGLFQNQAKNRSPTRFMKFPLVLTSRAAWWKEYRRGGRSVRNGLAGRTAAGTSSGIQGCGRRDRDVRNRVWLGAVGDGFWSRCGR